MNDKKNWNLEELYNSILDWENSYNQTKINFLKLKNNINNLEINELIDEHSNILQNKDKLYGFIKLKLDKNCKQNLKEQVIKIQELDNDIAKLTSIVNDKIIANKNKVKLENKRYIEKLQICNKKIDYNIYTKTVTEMNIVKEKFRTLCNSMKYEDVIDSNNKKYKITINDLPNFLRSNDRKLRKNSYESIEYECKKNKDKFADYLYTYIKSNIYLIEALQYKDCLFASLSQEEICYDNYKVAINYINNNSNIFSNILKIKKEKEKLKEIFLYDLFTQTSNSYISFNDAKKIIIDALSILGEEYINTVNKIFNENWIDIYEEKNKASYAYTYNIYGEHPFILVNYKCRINDVFVLAHEIGHAVHYYMTNTNQNYLNSKVTSINTEIVAMVNECLVYSYLLKQNNYYNEEILLSYIDKFRTILCKQSILNEFEDIVYKKIKCGEYLKSNELCIIYKKILKKYYGKEINLNEDVYEWTRVPQLFKGFHNYKYIISFCVAIKITNNIIKLKNEYVNMLKSGNSKNIKQLLRTVNIQIDNNDIYIETFNKFKILLQKYREIN